MVDVASLGAVPWTDIIRPACGLWDDFSVLLFSQQRLLRFVLPVLSLLDEHGNV